MLLVLGEVLAEFGCLVACRCEDPVQASVGVDKLGCRLLPHPRHPGKVVRRVAPKGRVGHVVGGPHAGALQYPGLVVQGIVRDAPFVVEHLDVGVLHQLVTIPVAGHHGHVPPGVAGHSGQGGNDVIGLEAVGFRHEQSQSVYQLPDQVQLLVEAVLLLLPVGLVGRQAVVAEGTSGPIKGHRHPVGLVVPQKGDQHLGEAEDGVGLLTRGGDHVPGDGKERPVGQRIAVEEE